MRLIEHDGKQILRRHGVDVPPSRLLEANEGPEVFPSGDILLKAQTLDGGRSKSGLVLKARSETAAEQLALLRTRIRERDMEDLILAEASMPPVREFYIAIRIGGPGQCAILMVGSEGGTDVESSARPLQIPIDPMTELYPHALLPELRKAGLPVAILGPLSRFAVQLYRVFVAEDAELIEINPLGLMGDGKLIPLDCKMEVDDSAEFRHREWMEFRSARLSKTGITALEKSAAKEKVNFVEMPGSVAVLTSGAGLGMAVVDALHDAGLSAANFIDTPAGISIESKIDVVFERARDPAVKAIAILILQTAQPLQRTMKRLLQMLDQAPPPKAMAICLIAAAGGESGMSLAEAKSELDKRGYDVVGSFDELIRSVHRLVNPVRG